MTDSQMIAALIAAGLVAWSTLFVQRKPAGNGCRRRGCRQEDGWQGCNHRRRRDGSRRRHFITKEGNE